MRFISVGGSSFPLFGESLKFEALVKYQGIFKIFCCDFFRMLFQKAMKSLKLTSRKWKRYALSWSWLMLDVILSDLSVSCLLTELKVSYDPFHQMISLIKNLKKENEFLKGKCENSDIALVKLIEEVMCALQKLIVTNQGTLLRPWLLITIHACLFSGSLRSCMSSYHWFSN